jgi:uncharacterized protein (TIGR03437 family)
MDAAYTTTLKKIALFLTIALLLAAPFAAQADTPAFSFPNGATASMTGTNYGCTEVDSTGAAITFTASQVPASGSTVDPTLGVNPGGIMTTGGQVCFQASYIPANVTAGTHTIQVNLNPSSPAGVTSKAITITWTPSGSSGSGGSNGSGASASASSLGMTSYAGSTGSTSFYLTSTVSSGTVGFNISTNYTTGSGWLSVSQYSGSLAAGGYQTFAVSGNPSGLANQTYNATLVITLSGAGSGTINIPVSFSVGSNTSTGNGNLTASVNPVNLSYATGDITGPSAFVSLTSTTGATTYNATVNTGSSWLLADYQSAVTGYALSGGLIISTIYGNLPTASSTGTILVTDSNNNTLTITVYLTVNGQSNGLSLSPNPVTLNAAVGQSNSASAILTVSSNTSGSLSITGTTGTGISAVLSNPNITAGGTQQVTVYGSPTGLVASTYSGTVTVTLNGTVSQTANVSFVVGSGSGGTSGSVAPLSLQFNYQQGLSGSLVPQNITEGVSGTYTTSVTTGNSWLTVSPASGTGPGLITVTVNPSGMVTSTTPYTGSFTVTTVTGTQTVNVSLLVSANAVVFANQPVQNLSYTGGSGNLTQSFGVYSSDGSIIPVSAVSSQSWLTVSPASGSTPSVFYLTVNGSALSNGVNVANVTITSSAADTQLTVPVVVTVTGSTSSSGSLTLGSSSLAFSAPLNGVPQSQLLSVTAPSITYYTATATGQSNGTTWLSITPSGGLNTGTTQSLTVTVYPYLLQAGNYTGQISLATSSGTQYVGVTLAVGSSSGITLTASPTSLSQFTYQTGGTVPAAQSFNVSTSGATASFAVTTPTQNGTNWLSASPTAGTASTTPVAISVSVSPTGLTPATYTGSVIVTPTGGTPLTMPVTLVVQGQPTVSASPATLSLSYLAGSSNTPTATVQVSGSAASLSFTANASSSGWLSVTPTSGSTGASGTTLQVTTNPSGLTAGNYSGTIIVSGASGATGTSTITVTLTVTAPLPTIQALVNAASGASGPVSPGEIVSIFAPSTNPIGPSTPAYLTVDSTGGNVLTTLGGVQVLFNGIPAPLTYVSSTQINAVVPYGIAGLFAPYAQVKYLGQGSNSFNLTTTATAPGIFTQSGTGTGTGAILNQDGSVNGPNRPAAKGSTVAVYMTGEGATSPTGITGRVNCPSGQACSISQLPVPLLPVTVTLIDSSNARYAANYSFAGEAPGFVSGAMQLNFAIPTNVPSGTLQLFVAVGGNSSQNGVTISVQ